MLEAVTDTAAAMAPWVDVLAGDAPNPAPEAPPGLAEPVNMFIGWLKWIVVVAGTAGLIICGLMMTVGRRNRSHMAAEGAAGIPWVLAGLSLAALAAGIINVVL